MHIYYRLMTRQNDQTTVGKRSLTPPHSKRVSAAPGCKHSQRAARSFVRGLENRLRFGTITIILNCSAVRIICGQSAVLKFEWTINRLTELLFNSHFCLSLHKRYDSLCTFFRAQSFCDNIKFFIIYIMEFVFFC